MCHCLNKSKKIYEIIDFTVSVTNLLLDDSGWARYEVGAQSPLYFDIQLESNVNKVSTMYSNIELYRNFNKGDQLLRLEEDLLRIDKDWKHGTIVSVSNFENVYTFLNILFYSEAAKKRMLQLHSSLIDFQGQGLMFLGPSGIGKTTQAELWNRYRDALIINGDIVFVQEKEDCFLGWGTPWHGSSPYCENASVPVKALVVLKQAPENSIRELTGFEKVTAVSNSVFYPQWLENGMELCLETLDHLLTRLPVYELCCRPDEEAVKLTEETIFH